MAERRHLPSEMRCAEASPSRRATDAGGAEGRGEEDRRAGVEARRATARVRAEEPRRRADADQRVVLLVLMGVDRVVADRPQDAAGVEEHRRPVEAAEDRRPAHQRPPRKGDPEAELRPVGDALHEGVDRDGAGARRCRGGW